MARSTPSVSIVIPTLNAERYVTNLVTTLISQTLCPREIIIIDSASTDATADLARKLACVVEVIDRSTFNHGGTRNLGARKSTGEILVFMTQDAVPADKNFLKNLVAEITDDTVAAAYARQIPQTDATPLETFARGFNYPPTSFRKSLADVTRLGIKAYFFSNVASAVKRSVFEKVNGFPSDLIINEDMILAAKILKNGYSIGYAAEAIVVHSHDYTFMDQFKRYFDMGVFVARAKGELPGARSGGEGFRFVKEQSRYLFKERHALWIPWGLMEAAYKFTGFRVGQLERYLPLWIKKRFSMHRFFWQ